MEKGVKKIQIPPIHRRLAGSPLPLQSGGKRVEALNRKNDITLFWGQGKIGRVKERNSVHSA